MRKFLRYGSIFDFWSAAYRPTRLCQNFEGQNFQNFKNGEIQKWPNLLEKFSMVPVIGFRFWIAHLVDLNEIYKNQVSEVKSEVGNHTEFSQQIYLFLHSVLLPFWKFFWHAQNRLVKELWPNRGREHGYFQHSKNAQNWPKILIFKFQKSTWKITKIINRNPSNDIGVH